MIIEKSAGTEGKITLAISGAINASTSEQLREEVAALPEETGYLILDLKDVYTVSSAGLREFLVCAKRFEGDRLRLINVNAEVMEVFRMTGLRISFRSRKQKKMSRLISIRRSRSS